MGERERRDDHDEKVLSPSFFSVKASRIFLLLSHSFPIKKLQNPKNPKRLWREKELPIGQEVWESGKSFLFLYTLVKARVLLRQETPEIFFDQNVLLP